MDKFTIQKRLHHRPPYLLIDLVVEHDPTSMKCEFTAQEQDFYILGHFPGMPIVPGAMMQEMTTQAAGLLITEHHSPVPNYDSNHTKGWALGVLRSIHFAKYKSVARPGERLLINVSLLEKMENSFRFKGFILVDDKKIMTNEFTLINISDQKLRS